MKNQHFPVNFNKGISDAERICWIDKLHLIEGEIISKSLTAHEALWHPTNEDGQRGKKEEMRASWLLATKFDGV